MGGGVLERLHAGRQHTLKSPVDHGASPVYEAIKYFDEIPNLNQKTPISWILLTYYCLNVAHDHV